MAKQQSKTVTGRVLHDPVKDKLRPMFPLDLSKCRTVDELVRAMGDTAFTGRQIGDAADVFEAMARDKDCFVVMTLSGALTVGKMGLVFCDLIESGVVKAIVSTGALMAHGLVEATGYSHFRYNPAMDDKELFQAGYNRVYDSLEPEVNLDHVEEVALLLLRERGGGLVTDQHPRFPRQHTEDLHHLSLADAQCLARRLQLQLHVELVDELRRARVHGGIHST